jgi:hydrogenase large subunit
VADSGGCIDPQPIDIILYKLVCRQRLSQWNAGARDSANVPGPYETALKGHVLVNLKQPLEVLRTIHSFAPCIGCAVHIRDPDGEPLVEVDINHATRC